MLSFQLVVLDRADVTPEVIAAMELAAFFRGEAQVSDLPIDEDEVRERHIESLDDEDLKADYRAEPEIAGEMIIEMFRADILNALNSRNDALADHYPFEIDSSRRLVRKPLDQLTAAGLSYLVLQFYRAIEGGSVEIIADSSDEEKKKRKDFNKLFEKIFEYIAGYTVSGRFGGASYMTSDCRHSKRLEVMLNQICKKVGGGSVHTHSSWSMELQAANDGGVDCVVHVGGPQLGGSAHMYLVGATIQKSSINHKIMDSSKIEFFTRFFANKPAAFHGALVRPQTEDALTKEKCVSRNCLLFSYDEVWSSMGKRSGDAYQNGTMRRLDAKARGLLHHFSAASFIYDFDEFRVRVA